MRSISFHRSCLQAAVEPGKAQCVEGCFEAFQLQAVQFEVLRKQIQAGRPQTGIVQPNDS